MSTEITNPPLAEPPVAMLAAGALPAEVTETARRFGVAQYLPRVLAFTSEIFGGFSRVFVTDDPEIPGDTHIVFEVRAAAPIETALAKDEKWGQRLLETIPRAPRVYSLSLDFTP